MSSSKRKLAPAKFHLYTNENGWTDDGLNISHQFTQMVIKWIKDHDSYNYMELHGLLHGALEDACVEMSLVRKFCKHKTVPDDEDYCEECGGRLERLD